MDVDSPLYAAPEVEVVVPVRNEERALVPNVRRLVAHLRDSFPFTARITIADNGSTDATWALARALTDAYPGLVRAVRLDLPGHGRALRAVWSASDADVVAYLDVDLSTDLAALFPLVAPLVTGDADVAIGSRRGARGGAPGARGGAPGARARRGLKRAAASRGYNLLLRATLEVGFSDAQCGFKALRSQAARALLPHVEDNAWFFDTELLVLAERAGLRIHEVPVEWIDSPDSRMRITATVLSDLRGVSRLWWGLGVGSLKVPVAPGGAACAADVTSIDDSVAEAFDADMPWYIANISHVTTARAARAKLRNSRSPRIAVSNAGSHSPLARRAGGCRSNCAADYPGGLTARKARCHDERWHDGHGPGDDRRGRVGARRRARATGAVFHPARVGGRRGLAAAVHRSR
jgi:Glycosyl transferase family 2